MDAATVTAWTAFLAQLDAVRWWLLLGIVLLALGATWAFFYYLRFRRDERREVEKGKAQRSVAYAGSLDDLRGTVTHLTAGVSKLTVAIDASADRAERNSAQNSKAVDHLSDNVAKMAQRLSSLVNKIDGRMSVQDSCRFIHHAFQHDLYREVCLILSAALRNNDYANRAQHVTRKVRTAMADAMTEARAYLTTYLLAVDPTEYFVVDQTASGERFVLVDQIWTAVEPKFNHGAGSLEHRTEEANLLIENAIRDYVVACYEQVMRTNPAAVPRTRTMKTPLPGSLQPTEHGIPMLSDPAQPSAIRRRSGGH